MKRIAVPVILLFAASVITGATTPMASGNNHSLTTSSMTQTYTPQPGDVKVLLTTSLGDITILLYGDIPGHRDNFIKRVEAGDYDGVLFHRVIDNFMIQTGDPTSKNAAKGQMLGEGDSASEIDAEFLFPTHYHHRGALAAARTGDNVNPKRRSSGSQFYIVTGKKYSPAQLDQMEHRALMQRKQATFDSLVAQHRDSIMQMRRNRDSVGLQSLQDRLNEETQRLTASDTTYFTPEIREAYTTQGGTPHLDGSYTVFGRVLQGMDIVEKIEKAATDANDRPIDDIKIISAKVIE